MPVFVAAYGLQQLAGGSGSIVMHVAGQPACDSHIPLLVWTLKRRTCMIRLEKAGREVDGRQHLARLLVHPQWQGQYVETMLLLQMESLLPEARRELLFPARDAADLRPLLWLGYTVSEEATLPHGLTLYRLEKGE